MDIKKAATTGIISIICLSLFVAVLNTTAERGQDRANSLPNCSINYAPNFTPSNSWYWTVEEVMNRTTIGFEDTVLLETDGELEPEDWPSALGIEPPCSMVKGALHVRGKNVMATYRPVAAFKEYLRAEKISTPKGEVYLAHYAVPTTTAIWRITEYGTYPRDKVRSETPIVECNCQWRDIIDATLRRIESIGFTEVQKGMKATENNGFKPLTSRLYCRRDKYLYVEFAKVKGLDLIRVLMVKGEKEPVEAYSKILSAGNSLEAVEDNPTKDNLTSSLCGLKTEPEFKPINAWTGWSVRHPLGNLYIEYHDGLTIMPVFSVENISPERPPGAVYGVDWPARIGITPKCAIAGSQVAFVTWSSKNATGSFCPTVRNKRCAINRQSPVLPGGKVYLATYMIPHANTTWAIQENLACRQWNDFLEPATCGKRETTIRGTCTCPVWAVIDQLEDAINATGFEEVPLEKKPAENDYFRPLSIKMYRRDNQYLYVEFTEIKGMDLIRVLMILGEGEEVVKAYAEGFTAVGGEG
ncbi:hypothetical protein [Thermococcus aciditolerans]|uniref:Uncharacterized protein n=1 Tax=Thermococcus aciditolerans TaxID=2598455 RepID=A0A5C0SNW7_9EURY|nr:hypothetical protein [Thermococcus aciditolerans]QEK14868.1 hypothetical protein FPV09_06940 [Thermococcus aciditolerans]